MGSHYECFVCTLIEAAIAIRWAAWFKRSELLLDSRLPHLLFAMQRLSNFAFKWRFPQVFGSWLLVLLNIYFS